MGALPLNGGVAGQVGQLSGVSLVVPSVNFFGSSITVKSPLPSGTRAKSFVFESVITEAQQEGVSSVG